MHLSNNSDISWFNLSEVIKRKEREKVLFCYRLLSHSIQNENFKRQLLADIYLFLEENDTAYLIYKEIFNNYLESEDYYGLISVFNRINSNFKKDINYFLSKIKTIKNIKFIYN